ncbi:MAG: hypothetical protein LBR10_02575 [Prevotellaceae bacterium]|nr:hypothetical protein [Prevotellaceae bacterium]
MSNKLKTGKMILKNELKTGKMKITKNIFIQPTEKVEKTKNISIFPTENILPPFGVAVIGRCRDAMHCVSTIAPQNKI